MPLPLYPAMKYAHLWLPSLLFLSPITMGDKLIPEGMQAWVVNDMLLLHLPSIFSLGCGTPWSTRGSPVCSIITGTLILVLKQSQIDQLLGSWSSRHPARLIPCIYKKGIPYSISIIIMKTSICYLNNIMSWIQWCMLIFPVLRGWGKRISSLRPDWTIMTLCQKTGM